jgi:hypothetical protein
MWTFETLQIKESWPLTDLPPKTTALIPDIDLRCLYPKEKGVEHNGQ